LLACAPIVDLIEDLYHLLLHGLKTLVEFFLSHTTEVRRPSSAIGMGDFIFIRVVRSLSKCGWGHAAISTHCSYFGWFYPGGLLWIWRTEGVRNKRCVDPVFVYVTVSSIIAALTISVFTAEQIRGTPLAVPPPLSYPIPNEDNTEN
jgi:hypothetical protein